MGLFSFFSSKKEVTSETMKELTSKWALDYTQNFRIKSQGVFEHEIYMFCGWIAWDYMLNNGYLPKDAKTNFLGFIHEKVNHAKQISDDEFMHLFTCRVRMYKDELKRLRMSSQPYLMESLYGALYKTIFLEKETYYDCGLSDEIGEICEFMDNFIDFWNKVNKELLSNFKKR